MGKRDLSAARCPVCRAFISRIKVDEEAIVNAKRVPIMIITRCVNGHPAVLLVDKNFMVREVEAAIEAYRDDDVSVQIGES